MSALPTPKIEPYGDHAILVHYPSKNYSDAIATQIQSAALELRKAPIWREVVTGYDSLVAVFDVAALPQIKAIRMVSEIIANAETNKTKTAGRLIEIPVNYGGSAGPDMETICQSSGLTEDEVIKTHSGRDYRVCMMGFIPGFTFLSAAPKKLHHARLKTPRSRVPAGSVGIANWQTGIYGLESPGGWQIIGQTPLSIFDKTRPQPFLIEAGDRVRFVPQ